MAHPLLNVGVTAGRIDPEGATRWATAVHQAVRESHGRVLGPVTAPGPGRNYYMVRMETRTGTPLRLLANLVTNLVAAADDKDPRALLAPFRDLPSPDVFSLYGFRVAAPEDLEEPVADDQLGDLAVSEQHEVNYHRPPRVGDIIFNWFD